MRVRRRTLSRVGYLHEAGASDAPPLIGFFVGAHPVDRLRAGSQTPCRRGNPLWTLSARIT